MAVTPLACKENVYMVKFSEQAQRYEEMVKFMEKVSAAMESKELTVHDPGLQIGVRRASWRIISSIEQKEESRGNEDHMSMIRDYRSKIESELSNICAATGDSKVFYLKMKGD